MQEFKQKWEDWYGDLLSAYQWHELDYNGREILYVFGNSRYTGDEASFTAAFIQVVGYVDSGASIAEEDQQEIVQLLRSRHGLDNICFWSV